MSTARGVMLKGVADIVTRGGGLITFPILIRYAGADGYGAFGQVNTIVAFLVPFVSFGLSGSMVRYFSIRDWSKATRSQFLRIAAIVLSATVIAGIAFALLAPLLNRLFLNWQGGTTLFAWGGLMMVISALETLMLSFFRSRQWFSQSSLIEISQALISIGAIVLLLPMGIGISGLFISVLILKSVLYAICYSGFWFWNRPLEAGTPEPLSLMPMISFGVSGIISSLGLWMMNLGDRLIIGHFLDAHALGLYAASYNFAFLLMAVNGPILMPAYPRIQVALTRGGPGDGSRECRFFHRYISVLIIPSALFLIFMSAPVLTFLGGDGLSVDPIMVAMVVLAVAMDQFNGIAHYVLYSKDQMKFSQNMWIISGIANLLLNVALVPKFGLRGAAFATLITFFALEWAIVAKATRYVRLSEMYRLDVAVKAIVCSSAAIAAVSLLLRKVPATLPGILSASAVFTVVYVAGLAIAGEVKKADFALLRNAVFGRLSTNAR
jgi:O-antigen/teichoic acid export membrane protein